MKAKELFPDAQELRKGRVRIELDKEQITDALKKLKENGYTHFVMLSCVDWIKEGKFELVYHMWSYEYKEHVMLSVKINRDGEDVVSNRELFPQIETYEREIHEMFGVNFVGNPRLGEFILEGWPHMPPMRKDFDTEKFVKDLYYKIPEVNEE
ncbi:MAG: NADH-quinone oxidoreductase subunit C [Euryarchaeota archaeon]|nr:NADH-quinone oxidoreductase subunit C [Euryarchaeota archaeon]